MLCSKSIKNEIILIKSTNINIIGLIYYLSYLMADWYLEKLKLLDRKISLQDNNLFANLK